MDTTKNEQIEVELLNRAFESFNKASSRLSDSYEVLQQKIDELNVELEMKNMELEENMEKMKRLEEQVRRQDRLAAMGELAAKAAHEIRNPLGSIELFASILKKELKDDTGKLEIIEHISEGVRNLDNVVSNFLTFTKFPKPKSQIFDLSEFLQELLDFISNVITQHGIVLKKGFSEKIRKVYGDKELLKQAFLNLILNAIQAMPEGGILAISTDKRTESDEAVISVSDTGGGITEYDRSKIFDPFYTTKDRGTGLGLTIVYNIIASHGWDIKVDSKKGEGTTFSVILPLINHDIK